MNRNRRSHVPHPGDSTSALPSPSAETERLTGLLKALSDPVRMGIVRALSRHENREACVSDLITAFPQSGPTISHHLKVLHTVRLIDRRREGTWLFYRLSDETLSEVASLLGDIGITRDRSAVPDRESRLQLAGRI
ncbi:metalloregulator ArsR/SmtB family transcription factor [Streptomyces sp. NPDC051976]|uniref:ArsR/SmtB family transcription factor n=1 Tax=Streptomyces sp. NPDC051976 TaxID=3154947 RepID=UPI003445EA9C